MERVNAMKQNQEQQLGLKEYTAIAIFMIGIKANEDTPTLLYNEAINASWMIPILSGVMFSIPLLLLIKTLSLNKDMNPFCRDSKIIWKICRCPHMSPPLADKCPDHFSRYENACEHH